MERKESQFHRYVDVWSSYTDTLLRRGN